jgi:pilus assembly protein Flp/PilA
MFRRYARVAVEFLRAEDGPTAVEYAVMLALIMVVCITAVTVLGSNSKTTYTKVSSTIGGTGS